jgi:sodium/bile acid cotransporter 7
MGMSIRTQLDRLNVDPYLLAIVSTAGLASILPCRGVAASGFDAATMVMIGVLFFLYGARLSPGAVWQGLANWRLQALVLGSTFGLFPLLGLAFRIFVPTVLSAKLYVGVLFLCMLPSTVQSSIAFTSIAGGNVAAAVCAASASSLIGIFATPLLATVLMRAAGGLSLHGVEAILLQILAPFVAGQLARPWIEGWLKRHRWLTALADRGSILLIVYTAFSASMVAGIWHSTDPASLGGVVVVDALLLALMLTITTRLARWLGFSRADETAIVFCGSKKSLAAGASMMAILFPPAMIGVVMLPLLLFHQIQLMTCATLARRYARGRYAKVGEPAYPPAPRVRVGAVQEAAASRP